MKGKIIVLILEILTIVGIIVTAEIAFQNYIEQIINSQLIA